MPWPAGILASLFGGGGNTGMIVTAETLAELRRKGEKIRVIRTFQK